MTKILISYLLFLSTVVSYGQNLWPKANQYYKNGESALRDGNWELSESYYDSCISISPRYFEAYYSRAIARENQENFEGAISDYGSMLHLNPEFTEALWSRGILRYQIGHYELANEDFYKLLELPEDETNAVYFSRKYPDKGVSDIETLETMKGLIYNYLGLVNHKLEHHELALRHYANALKNDSINSDILVNRSQTYEDMGRLDYAIVDIQAALRLDPTNTVAKYNLARLQEMGQTNPDDLVETYTTIIEDSPYFAEAYAKRGLAKMQSGDLSGALQDYDSAIYYDEKDALKWLNRGIIHMRLQYYDHAYSDLTKAIQLDSDLEDAYLNRGNLHMKLENYEKAVKDYDVALLFYPGYALAYYNRGIAHYNSGNKTKACADVKKAFDLGFSRADDTFRRMCK